MDRGRAHALPIFHEDDPFRSDRMFRDMQRHMQGDLGRFHRPADWGRPFDDDFDSLCQDLGGASFHLKPRAPRLSSLQREECGSRESLDDETVNNLFIEDPQTKSRKFYISFDVKDYEPNDITVNVEGDTLIVEAKHENGQEGAINVKEFNRKIKIPTEVDPDKLGSKLSKEGILSIFAPMPPHYQSVTYTEPAKREPVHMSQQIPPHIPQHMPPQMTHQVPPQHMPPPMTHHQAPPQHMPPPMTHHQAPPQHMPPTYISSQTIPPPHIPQPQSPQAPLSPQQNIPQAQVLQQPMPQVPAAVKMVPQVVDTPVYMDTESGRKMALVVQIGDPYKPDDILVKVDGLKLIVEAEHEDVAQGRTSKTSMSRSFDLDENIDPNSVVAALGADGRLKIEARIPMTN